jgi:GntR family transcriptional regulator
MQRGHTFGCCDSRVSLAMPDQRMLDCAEGLQWLRVETLRTPHSDPLPMCLTVNYLNLDLPDVEKGINHLTGRISAMLENRYGVRIMSIEQSIQAVRLDKREAKLLLAKAGSPGLRALRRYYDETARLLELSDALHPVERVFTYTTRLKRDA